MKPPTAAWKVSPWHPWHFAKLHGVRFMCRVCGFAAKTPGHEETCPVRQVGVGAPTCPECKVTIVVQHDHRIACDTIMRLANAERLSMHEKAICGLSHDEVEAMIPELELDFHKGS